MYWTYELVVSTFNYYYSLFVLPGPFKVNYTMSMQVSNTILKGLGLGLGSPFSGLSLEGSRSQYRPGGQVLGLGLVGAGLVNIPAKL